MRKYKNQITPEIVIATEDVRDIPSQEKLFKFFELLFKVEKRNKQKIRKEWEAL